MPKSPRQICVPYSEDAFPHKTLVRPVTLKYPVYTIFLRYLQRFTGPSKSFAKKLGDRRCQHQMLGKKGLSGSFWTSFIHLYVSVPYDLKNTDLILRNLAVQLWVMRSLVLSNSLLCASCEDIQFVNSAAWDLATRIEIVVAKGPSETKIHMCSPCARPLLFAQAEAGAREAVGQHRWTRVCIVQGGCKQIKPSDVSLRTNNLLQL